MHKHIQFFMRAFIVFFWITLVGVVVNTAYDSSNLFAIGWFGFCLYGFIGIAVVYMGHHLSTSLWNIKK